VTDLLRAWRAGDRGASERLFELVYPTLLALAGRSLGGADRRFLDTREVLHEAYLRLVQQERVDWQNRSHFFALAATMIRRIVVDDARRRRRKKRGGESVQVPLEALRPRAGGLPAVDLLALDAALGELAQVNAPAARIVELRCFAGLTLDETADALDLGRATVARGWRFARAYLADRLLEPGARQAAPES
jgi:RNA polymerase sigma factor (TIGR02999 family)